MVNTLSSDEMTEVIRKAFGDLSEEEQENIMRIAGQLRDNIKAKHPNIRFGLDATLELLACLGMAMNDNRIRFVKP